MKAQKRTYTCGVAAIANALECLGIKKTQGHIMRLMHCDPVDGTVEEEIKRGLMACGAAVDEREDKTDLGAMYWLQTHLKEYGPAILCVDSWEHWVTVVGSVVQTTFLVFDPAGSGRLLVYDWDALATRWRLGKKSGGPSFYGIGVSL